MVEVGVGVRVASVVGVRVGVETAVTVVDAVGVDVAVVVEPTAGGRKVGVAVTKAIAVPPTLPGFCKSIIGVICRLASSVNRIATILALGTGSLVV
jgi:hypothetical protein